MGRKMSAKMRAKLAILRRSAKKNLGAIKANPMDAALLSNTTSSMLKPPSVPKAPKLPKI